MYDASQKREVRDKLFDILFLRTPISILGTTKVEGIELALNHLEGVNIVNCSVILWTLIIFDKLFLGERAVVTDEKYALKCELAFRSIGYRSIQADPDIPFDSTSSTVPQSIGIDINFYFLIIIYT